jgi:hypothetical protein
MNSAAGREASQREIKELISDNSARQSDMTGVCSSIVCIGFSHVRRRDNNPYVNCITAAGFDCFCEREVCGFEIRTE